MNVYIVLGCFRDEGAHIVGIWDSQIDATRHRKELDDTKTYDYTELIPFEKNKRHEKTYYQERESV